MKLRNLNSVELVEITGGSEHSESVFTFVGNIVGALYRASRSGRMIDEYYYH
jgi:hypothetical protein